MTGPEQGSWQPDPDGRFEHRWWDGRNWTDQVALQGRTFTAPLGGPRKGSTTIRLRITPASFKPLKDVSTRTFPGAFDSISVKPGGLPPFEKATVKSSQNHIPWQPAQQAIDLGKYVPKKLPPQP